MSQNAIVLSYNKVITDKRVKAVDVLNACYRQDGYTYFDKKSVKKVSFCHQISLPTTFYV